MRIATSSVPADKSLLLAILTAATMALNCLFSPIQAAAETCEAQDFSREVDQSGAVLRNFNSSMTPELDRKLQQLKAAKGWNDQDFQNLAQDYLFDAKTAGLDSKANALLDRLDELGSVGEQGGADCSKLAELKATGVELLAVMKAKSAHTLQKIDEEIAKGNGSAAGDARTALRLPDAEVRELLLDKETEGNAENKQAPAEGIVLKPSQAEKAAVAEKRTEPRKQQPPESRPPAEKPKSPRTESWETVTEAAPPQPVAPGDESRVALNDVPSPENGPAPPLPLPPDAFAGPDEGYTVEEIRDATRGFFGTISTNLATVIEHAFSQWGRPTAYVLGQEGGGAFLAGLRYGDGTLFMRSGVTRKVYWHGPSLGYDFGAEGSRTLYLIYSLGQPDDLFRRYTGIDGSAYLVGGVGVTLLKGGPVILAPIRSGIGLRIGANIGYVRFSREPTWNPF